MFGVPIRLCGHVRARPARARLSGFAWRSRTTKFCIPDRVIRKPNPPAADRRRAQSMCGSREQRVLTTIAVVVSACVNPYPTRVDPYTVASVDT